jgi:uncharacterized membrane protein (TIGR02234 family)
MTDRLTSKRMVLVIVLLSGSVILVSGSREWVQGSVDDAVLGATVLHGNGSEVAPGAMAAALVGLSSAVAAATSGAVVRVIAAGAALLAAVLGATVVASVVADPGGALGALAAAGTGRSGTLAAHGRVGVWAWLALAAMLAMGVGGLGALVGARRWRGLSSRYDGPVSGAVGQVSRHYPARRPATGPESAWDRLSRGEDPTAGR